MVMMMTWWWWLCASEKWWWWWSWCCWCWWSWWWKMEMMHHFLDDDAALGWNVQWTCRSTWPSFYIQITVVLHLFYLLIKVRIVLLRKLYQKVMMIILYNWCLIYAALVVCGDNQITPAGFYNGGSPKVIRLSIWAEWMQV